MKQDEKTLDNTERQRKFKAKLYEAGFKQMLVWVKRSPKKRAGNIDQKTFFQKLKKLTLGMREADQHLLYSLLLQIAGAKKEVLRLKKKHKTREGKNTKEKIPCKRNNY
ncbi:MAG: hypothetical protein LBU85_04770 [Treponema sp.]|jgi:hypothetical protein|nr:hypothetical protein [Treponema sp.]